ncbi:hypothetical protein SELMODRAFT_409910 [Selaginella moellendorffii]|uniref:Uncharacterized protein n=1 Tax=Selaginella moellendorffii TaxID=88036 RepID=D8RCV2_SELML|nr:hypothetical protein SELMODRAFT_409910 [Selaginella moellendorffii]
MSAEVLQSLQSWWQDYVWSLKLEDIAAGKVIKMFDARLTVLRGADKRLSGLYVRRTYGPLFEAITSRATEANGDWICHLNGNSGVGKSAFLWYFIIRAAILLRDSELRILYESAGFIWEFRGNTVHVAKRDEVSLGTFINAPWHLINQKVPTDGALGRVLLVAASPAAENVKAAKADRKKTVMYMYPWEEDEYTALVGLWRVHYQNVEAEMKTIQASLRKLEEWAKVTYQFGESMVEYSTSCADLAAVPILNERVQRMLREDVKEQGRPARELAFQLQVLIETLEKQVQAGFQRVEAAPEYYKWFGGVVRKLWSGDTPSLNQGGFLKKVQKSLNNTNLLRLLGSTRGKSRGEDISWRLLHFKPAKSSSFQDYYLDFCSVKVQAQFTLALTSMKPKDLELFMWTALPEDGVLQGLVFQELSTAYVLRGATLVMPLELIPLLRYYEGDLKAALLEAGADAIHYVWRPVIQNNGAVDYTILPRTLAQPTLAACHPVAAEALQTHISALRAWNDIYGGTSKPEEFVLCFFLAKSNYDEFGFQSYRDKSRRVTKQAVKGIRQCKVLLRYTVPAPCAKEMVIPKGVEIVDDIEQCKFDGEVCETNFFDPGEDLRRDEEYCNFLTSSISHSSIACGTSCEYATCFQSLISICLCHVMDSQRLQTIFGWSGFDGNRSFFRARNVPERDGKDRKIRWDRLNQIVSSPKTTLIFSPTKSSKDTKVATPTPKDPKKKYLCCGPEQTFPKDVRVALLD